ncbi:MAG: lipoyl synthase [Candidatus Aminicenantales bacterium]
MTAYQRERIKTEKKPSWLKVKLPSHPHFFSVSSLLKEKGLNTICQSARCPNQAECWSQKTATFLILGNICSRRCSFCAVQKGLPLTLSQEEPEQVAETVASFGLSYAVVTSVTRDDLDDGGASQFTRTVRAIKRRISEAKVEVLIPDFNGNENALNEVIRAKPDVLSHNLETTEALYPQINRPVEYYRRSLKVLEKAGEMGILTKSGLMAGLGETEEELFQTFKDLRSVACSLLTIGQYLQPTRASIPVRKYYSPQEFTSLRKAALSLGFKEVVSGPLVRSSFHARQLYDSCAKAIVPSCAI